MRFREFITVQQDISDLMDLAEAESANYAVVTLDKLEKIATYLVHTKLQKNSDLARFEKFLALIDKELPEMKKAAKEIRKSLTEPVAHYSKFS
jgi:hypothetical protein